MKRFVQKLGAFIKGIIILLRPNILLGWLRHPFLTASNILSLTKWIHKQDKSNILNDFYSFKRDYSKRYKLYEYIIEKLGIKDQPIDYLEFGVSQGHSFRWWIGKCTNSDSRFYGFDTFEGLPENWGTFSKGDMNANVPTIDDPRGFFVKGLFQNTLNDFLFNHNLNNGKRKVIHLDADLFSSTLFALTSLAPYLKAGDVLIFDEFNVPNHEFFAFKVFSDSYYVKVKLLGAVNNYFQVAMIIVE